MLLFLGNGVNITVSGAHSIVKVSQADPKVSGETTPSAYTMTQGTDYTMNYTPTGSNQGTEDRTVTVTITGIGKFSGQTKTVTYTQKADTACTTATTCTPSTSYTYSSYSVSYNGGAVACNAEPLKSKITVTANKTTTTKDAFCQESSTTENGVSITDFSVSYSPSGNNTGTSSRTVTGTVTHNGSTAGTFTFTQNSGSTCQATVTSTTYTYRINAADFDACDSETTVTVYATPTYHYSDGKMSEGEETIISVLTTLTYRLGTGTSVATASQNSTSSSRIWTVTASFRHNNSAHTASDTATQSAGPCNTGSTASTCMNIEYSVPVALSSSVIVSFKDSSGAIIASHTVPSTTGTTTKEICGLTNGKALTASCSDDTVTMSGGINFNFSAGTTEYITVQAPNSGPTTDIYEISATGTTIDSPAVEAYINIKSLKNSSPYPTFTFSENCDWVGTPYYQSSSTTGVYVYQFTTEANTIETERNCTVTVSQTGGKSTTFTITQKGKQGSDSKVCMDVVVTNEDKCSGDLLFKDASGVKIDECSIDNGAAVTFCHNKGETVYISMRDNDGTYCQLQNGGTSFTVIEGGTVYINISCNGGGGEDTTSCMNYMISNTTDNSVTVRVYVLNNLYDESIVVPKYTVSNSMEICDFPDNTKFLVSKTSDDVTLNMSSFNFKSGENIVIEVNNKEITNTTYTYRIDAADFDACDSETTVTVYATPTYHYSDGSSTKGEETEISGFPLPTITYRLGTGETTVTASENSTSSSRIWSVTASFRHNNSAHTASDTATQSAGPCNTGRTYVNNLTISFPTEYGGRVGFTIKVNGTDITDTVVARTGLNYYKLGSIYEFSKPSASTITPYSLIPLSFNTNDGDSVNVTYNANGGYLDTYGGNFIDTTIQTSNLGTYTSTGNRNMSITLVKELVVEKTDITVKFCGEYKSQEWYIVNGNCEKPQSEQIMTSDVSYEIIGGDDEVLKHIVIYAYAVKYHLGKHHEWQKVITPTFRSGNLNSIIFEGEGELIASGLCSEYEQDQKIYYWTAELASGTDKYKLTVNDRVNKSCD